MTGSCARCGYPINEPRNYRRCAACRADDAERARRHRAGRSAPASSAIPATKASRFSDDEWSYDATGDCLTLGEYRRVREAAPVVHVVAVGR